MSERLLSKYRDLKMEHRWYRRELLEMVGTEDRGSDLWDEYREEMKRTGRDLMQLSRKLNARCVDTETERTHSDKPGVE